MQDQSLVPEGRAQHVVTHQNLSIRQQAFGILHGPRQSAKALVPSSNLAKGVLIYLIIDLYLAFKYPILILTKMMPKFHLYL